MLRKDSRYECLFCGRLNLCSRLEFNAYIIGAIQENGYCPDRSPIWINPSCRISSFLYNTDTYYVIGCKDPISPNKYYRVPSREIKEYLGEILV